MSVARARLRHGGRAEEAAGASAVASRKILCAARHVLRHCCSLGDGHDALAHHRQPSSLQISHLTLDFFPKTQSELAERTLAGALISVLSVAFIVWAGYAELRIP